MGKIRHYCYNLIMIVAIIINSCYLSSLYLSILTAFHLYHHRSLLLLFFVLKFLHLITIFIPDYDSQLVRYSGVPYYDSQVVRHSGVSDTLVDDDVSDA